MRGFCIEPLTKKKKFHGKLKNMYHRICMVIQYHDLTRVFYLFFVSVGLPSQTSIFNCF